MRRYISYRSYLLIFIIFLLVIISVVVTSLLVKGQNSAGTYKEIQTSENKTPDETTDKGKGLKEADKTPEPSTKVEVVQNSQTDTKQGNDTKKNLDSTDKFPKDKTVFYNGSSSKMQIALTFDDGPDNNYTLKVLDILKQYNIKATFFVIGRNVKTYPNSLKRIDSEGHVIGVHTYNHADLNKLTPAQVQEEITSTENIIDSLVGHHCKIMRPPYGLNSAQTIQTIADMGYKVIDWSVDTRDWAGTSPAQMMDYIQKQTKPGGIILHHCSQGKYNLDNTVSVLPTEIQTLVSKGYQFVTVPELLSQN